MLFYVKSRGLDDPNTIALYSTHNKATSKTASEAHGVDILHCNFQDSTTQICNYCFHFFPFYSHTRELVFDCF